MRDEVQEREDAIDAVVTTYEKLILREWYKQFKDAIKKKEIVLNIGVFEDVAFNTWKQKRLDALAASLDAPQAYKINADIESIPKQFSLF